jgi:hypothetical protein
MKENFYLVTGNKNFDGVTAQEVHRVVCIVRHTDAVAVAL